MSDDIEFSLTGVVFGRRQAINSRFSSVRLVVPPCLVGLCATGSSVSSLCSRLATVHSSAGGSFSNDHRRPQTARLGPGTSTPHHTRPLEHSPPSLTIVRRDADFTNLTLFPRAGPSSSWGGEARPSGLTSVIRLQHHRSFPYTSPPHCTRLRLCDRH